MYDGVLVLIDAILRLLRKKPDILRATIRRNANANVNNTRIMDCNPKGKLTPYEHGDKISRMIKKVRKLETLLMIAVYTPHFDTL